MNSPRKHTHLSNTPLDYSTPEARILNTSACAFFFGLVGLPVTAVFQALAGDSLVGLLGYGGSALAILIGLVGFFGLRLLRESPTVKEE